jgi:predicted NACHT family NTPase
MIDLTMVTGAIVAMGVEATWEKAKRLESVIKLLQRFNLDPTNPPTDFDGVYIYTLVEYGVGRPEPILNFFRYKFVKEAFEQAFYKNDPSILDKEAEGIIQWNEETGKLGRIDYDPRREFAAFSAVFHELVDRTRTPAEVKRDQKLDNIREDIHQTSAEIVKRLDALVDLSEVRNERDRLVQKSPLNSLAQQMRDWFKTLNYSFESYDVQVDTYFEWIINIPARRGYDRILVRGFDGEVEVSDVVAVYESVAKQKTKEGWLVAVRRISQAARGIVKKQEYCNLFCYTFDELLDEYADFSGYLNWLEDEVSRRGIDKMYVPLACTKEDIDPVTKIKIGEGRYDEQNGWIDGYIDRWLDDPSKEHISILGEFGTGKTWFLLHYAWVSLQRYRDAKARGIQRPRLPLVIPLRDYAKAVSVESLFSEFFFRKHEIPLPGYSAFEQLNRMGKLLLMFDGFDEMADRVDRQKMINNFWELARVVVPNAKVILTCRTEHFPEAKEGRALLNAELQASTANLIGEPPKFEVLELCQLTNTQVRQLLSFRTNPNVIEKVMRDHNLLEIVRRPVMIELILDALPAIESGKPIDLSRVYLYAIRRKMERDIKDERTFTSLADKLYFLSELSFEMLSTDQMSLNYRLFPDQLRRLFGPAVQTQKDLDHWHYDMLGQTLLIRDADGDYTPAHRSLLEFFVAYKFVAELGVLSADFTELACRQSYVDGSKVPSTYTWSSYFRRIMNEDGDVDMISPLSEFMSEKIDQLGQTVGKVPLTRAILDFMNNMLIPEDKVLRERLLSIIVETRGRTEEEVAFLGGNVASLLISKNNLAFRGDNLSKTNLRHAILDYADLTGCNLTGADLHRVSFRNTKMVDTLLQGSKMNEVEIKPMEGWITSSSTSMGTNSYKVAFYYLHISQLRELPKRDIELKKDEIMVAAVNEDNILWTYKIHSQYIFECKFDEKEKTLNLLTIEGEIIVLDLETGQRIVPSETVRVQLWNQADLTKVTGLSERNAYFLKISGASHVPASSYDPKKDSEFNPEKKRGQ